MTLPARELARVSLHDVFEVAHGVSTTSGHQNAIGLDKDPTRRAQNLLLILNHSTTDRLHQRFPSWRSLSVRIAASSSIIDGLKF